MRKGWKRGVALWMIVCMIGVPIAASPVMADEIRIMKIATNGSCYAAIDSNRRLHMWGFDGYGQLDVPKALPPVVDVGVGMFCVVALDVFGKLHAWGSPEHGETDFGDGLPPFAAISVSAYQTVARTADGQIFAWGNTNQGGQQGVPSDLPRVSKHITGSYIVSALDGDGNAYEWGSYMHGKLDLPVKIVDIAANSYQTAALGEDGAVYGADQSFDLNMFFEPMPEIPSISKIFAGGELVAAVDPDGRLYMWGNYAKDEGMIRSLSVPMLLPPVDQVVLCRGSVTCLGADGKLYGWGKLYDQYKADMPAGLDGFASMPSVFLAYEYDEIGDEAAVATEAELFDAIRNGYTVVRCVESIEVVEDIFVGDIDSFMLIIEEGVTFTYSAYNFMLPKNLRNDGEIVVRGRVVLDWIPDELDVGAIRREHDGAVEYTGVVRDLSEIGPLLEENSIFNSVCVFPAREDGVVLLESDFRVPDGFSASVWGTDAVLKIAKGVTLAIDGEVYVLNDPVVEGSIELGRPVFFGISHDSVHKKDGVPG